MVNEVLALINSHPVGGPVVPRVLKGSIMSKHVSARPLPEFPGCPSWVPPLVFLAVLVVVLYLVQIGYTVESAIVMVLSVAAASGEVVRRLRAIPSVGDA